MTKPIINAFTPIEVPSIQRYKSYLPNAFDETLTILQKVNKVIKTLELLGEVSADVVAQWNEVMSWVMDEGLTESVIEKINAMVEDGSLADVINEDVFQELNDKIIQQKADLINQINQMASISFKGVYNTLTDLQTAKPTGDSGIYVLMSDGHMYSWLNGSWTDCGSVFTTPFPDNSITARMRSKNGSYLVVQSSGYLNINTTNKTLEFPSGTLQVNLMSTTPSIASRYGNTSLDLSFGGSTGGWIYFNTDTLTFKVVYSGSGEIVGENDVFFAVIFWSTNTFYMNANFTVDGKTNFVKRSIPYNQTSYLANKGRLLSTKKVQIDPVNKKVIFPSSATIMMIIGNETKVLSDTLGGTTWDLSSNTANYIVYDQTDLTLKSVSSMSLVTETQCFLGYINWGSNFAVDLDFNYEVVTATGSQIITFSYNKWKGKTLNALGDSTTYGDDGSGGSNSISWVASMQQLNNFGTVVNSGVKGSTIAIQSGRSDSFVERWNSLGSADLFAVLGGVNDFNKNIPMGSFLSTDQTTFKGALNVIIKGLLAKFPTSTIVFMTPMKNNKSIGFTPSYTSNGQGLKQLDYVNAIKETCDYYGLPVLDLYTNSGISPFVTEQANAYMPDLLHYNQAGYLRLATKISSFIEAV
jgi:lysophospholipase L1-like esterase